MTSIYINILRYIRNNFQCIKLNKPIMNKKIKLSYLRKYGTSKNSLNRLLDKIIIQLND